MARKQAGAAERAAPRAYSSEGALTPNALKSLLKRLMGSRTTAYLVVSDGRSEKCFFFPIGAARLSAIGRRSVFTLEELVQQDPRATLQIRRQIDHLMENGVAFDEAASQSGLHDVVRAASTKIVRDELLDIVVWPQATYEYCERNPPPRFYDVRRPSVKLSFGVKHLFEELVSGIERYQKAVGRRTVTADLPVKRKGHPVSVAGVSREDGERIVSFLAGGELPFDELVLMCRRADMSPIDAATGILALAKAEVLDIPLRPPPVDPGRKRARAKEQAHWLDGYLDILIGELSARRHLATAYEDLGEPEKAAGHLRHVALELENRHNFGEAIDAFKKLLGMSPKDFPIRRRLMGILERIGRRTEAFDEGVVLARDYKKFGLLNRAKQVFRYLTGMRQEDTSVRRELIDLLVRMGDQDGALRELENLAALYENRGDEVAALAMHQQILGFDPTHQISRDRLQRAVRRSWSFLAPAAGLAGGLLVLVVLGLMAWGRVREVRAFEATRTAFVERARAGDFAGARSALERFELQYGAGLTDALREQLDRLAREARSSLAATAFGEGASLEGAGNLVAARERYKRVQASFPETDWADHATKRLAALEGRERDAGRMLRRLLRASDNARRKPTDLSAYQDAVEIAQQLVRDYGWSPSAVRAELPIRIETRPKGAWVRVNGVEQEGRRTPCEIRHPLLPPFELTVGARGFEPLTRKIDLREPSFGLPLVVDLPRRRRWTFATLGPLLFPPAVGSDVVVVAGTDQRVYAIGPNGRARWYRALAPDATPSSRPALADGTAVIAADDGVVRGLSLRSGALRWERKRVVGVRVVDVGYAGSVVLQEPTRLVGIRAKDGAILWESKPLRGELRLDAVKVPRRPLAVVLTDQGFLQAIQIETGAAVLSVRLGGRPTAPPVFCGLGYAVASDDGLLRVVSTDGKRYLWQRELPGPVLGRPAYLDGVLYVGAGNQLLAFRVEDGSSVALAEGRFRSAIKAAPVARAGRVYVGTTGGRAYALAARTGRRLWSAPTGGAVVSPVEVFKRTVYLASTDRTLYALED